MTTSLSPKLFRPLGAVSLSIAALASEMSAQSQSTPGRPLSDAIAEAMRSPFQADRAPLGGDGQGLLLPVVAYPTAARGWSTLLSAGLPGTVALPAQVESSPGRRVSLTIFAGVASHLISAFFLRCYSGNDDYGRFTAAGQSGVTGSAPQERKGPCRSHRPGIDWVEGTFFLLVPTLTTAGGATLGGSGFVRAAGGSALGFVGSGLYYMGMKDLTKQEYLEGLPILMWFLGGLIHGVATAYLSG